MASLVPAPASALPNCLPPFITGSGSVALSIHLNDSFTGTVTLFTAVAMNADCYPHSKVTAMIMAGMSDYYDFLLGMGTGMSPSCMASFRTPGGTITCTITAADGLPVELLSFGIE